MSSGASVSLINHLVGASEQRRRNVEGNVVGATAVARVSARRSASLSSATNVVDVT
jgi:hypothetical protein